MNKKNITKQFKLPVWVLGFGFWVLGFGFLCPVHKKRET